MNVLLDLVLCGPGARLCGGMTQLLSRDRDEVCNDPKFWDALAGKESPPIPKEIDISKSSDSDDDDSVSLLSEIEVSKAFNRYQEAWLRQALTSSHAAEEQHDLHLEEIVGTKDSDSLVVSSFDSRMGDTRVLEMEEEKGGCANDSWDDGSSYSSYYFRLRPKSQERETSTSWQTTSTRTTRSARNPCHFHRYDE